MIRRLLGARGTKKLSWDENSSLYSDHWVHSGGNNGRAVGAHRREKYDDLIEAVAGEAAAGPQIKSYLDQVDPKTHRQKHRAGRNWGRAGVRRDTNCS